MFIIGGILALYSIYSLIMALFSLKRSPVYKEAPPEHRLAFLVAARNEASVIGNLLESLFSQNYPRDRYEVIVVPNNCTDQTREICLAAGARVLDCTVPVKSKGDVLNFAFTEIVRQSPEIDAVCVIDADNLVHADFLTEMNNALASGARAAQGYRDSKNPFDNWLTGSYSIYFWLLIRFINRARSAIGLSAMIGGSGFMVRTDLLRQMNGARTLTITEDLELTALFYLADEKIAWVPTAVTYDEHPVSFQTAWTQRTRWSNGMYQIAGLYFFNVLRKAIKERSLQGFDLAMQFVAAHLQVLSTAAALTGGLLGYLLMQQGAITQVAFFGGLVLSTTISILVVIGVACVTVILEQKTSVRLLKAIALFWLFIFSWMPINVLCLFRRSSQWDEIKHSRDIRIRDLHGRRKPQS